MPDSLTLAHISDLHLPLPPGFGPRHWNVKRGLGYLNWHRGRRFVHSSQTVARLVEDMRRHAPDHIAVTGDLVNIGLPVEYEAARAWLEALGPPEQVSVVPGNHDIYVHLTRDAGVGRWAPYMADDAWGRGLCVRATSSAAAGGAGTATVDTMAARAAHNGLFPYVRRVGCAALIGLNSAEPTRPFVAAGRLGAEQLAALGRALRTTRAAGLVRVVLIHHPPLSGQAPRLRGLVDAPDLERVLAAEGAEVVLHGHNHRDGVVRLERPAGGAGGEGAIPVVGICSGSASRVHHGEPLARYNLLRIHRVDGAARITLEGRGFAVPGGSVVELQRLVLA